MKTNKKAHVNWLEHIAWCNDTRARIFNALNSDDPLGSLYLQEYGRFRMMAVSLLSRKLLHVIHTLSTENSYPTVSEIAQFARITNQTAANTLLRLKHFHYVEVGSCNSDQRYTHYMLCDKVLECALDLNARKLDHHKLQNAVLKGVVLNQSGSSHTDLSRWTFVEL